jgi:hypothetical protein
MYGDFMSPLVNTILSLTFLVAGGISLVLMMAQFGGIKFANPTRATRMHRILGWIYVALFLTLFVVMIQKIEQYWEILPPRLAIHVALAVALFFLIAVKVAIPRYFPGLAKHLFLFGVATYLTGFVLVGITAGYYLLFWYRKVPYISHAAQPVRKVDHQMGLELVITKCSTCHLMRDIMTPRLPREWEEVVNRMVELAHPRINPTEAGMILQFLAKEYAPRKPASEEGISTVDRYCAPCHKPDEILKWNFDRKGWENIVRRMNKRAPDIIPLNKISSIVDSLASGNR